VKAQSEEKTMRKQRKKESAGRKMKKTQPEQQTTADLISLAF